MSDARLPPAFVARRHDDDVSSAVEELGLDDLPDGEVLVEVAWSSVNYKDGMVTVPGNRVTRTVAARARGRPRRGGGRQRRPGAGGRGPRSSPTAATSAWPATAGTPRYARSQPGTAIALPDGLSARHAMAIGTAGFTAALSARPARGNGACAPATGPCS